MPGVRPIADHDWPAVVTLEAQAYSGIGLSEDRAALESRARTSPRTCLVVDVGQQVAAYVLALPYPLFRYPALARPEAESFSSANLHLHDLVVGKEFRGRGLARQLERQLAQLAASLKYTSISLIAVAGSRDFWAGCGYDGLPAVSVPLSYGANAVYMTRMIHGIPALDPQHPIEESLR
jgi:ribosomal protein S18 acetylase RimI-like enzyme